MRHGTRSQSRKQAVHIEETLALVLSGGQLVYEGCLAIGAKARQAGEVLAALQKEYAVPSQPQGFLPMDVLPLFS